MQEVVGSTPIVSTEFLTMNEKFYVYILYSLKLDKYYTGSTEDVHLRLNQHNIGRSKFTKSGIPWLLKYVDEFDTRKEAVKREYEIKSKKSRSYIEGLFKGKNVPYLTGGFKVAY